MKLLRTIRDSDVFPGSIDRTPTDFAEKTLVKAVIFDEDERVGLVHASKHRFDRLPGGIVPPDSKVLESLKAQVRNEVGCDIDIIEELGEIVEFRQDTRERWTCYCYIVRPVEGTQNFTPTKEETADGHEVKWYDGLDLAISAVLNSHADSYDARYIIERDTTFLREAELSLQ